MRLYDANGPLWYRGWATDSDDVACAKVDSVLAKTGTRRMIMGHTPDFHVSIFPYDEIRPWLKTIIRQNIVARCDGKIIIIDTGISHAYGGVLSALSIHYELFPVGKDGEDRWVERETVNALYEHHSEVVAEDEREIVGDFRVDTA
jgi:hypothetical protein